MRISVLWIFAMPSMDVHSLPRRCSGRERAALSRVRKQGLAITDADIHPAPCEKIGEDTRRRSGASAADRVARSRDPVSCYFACGLLRSG